MPDLMIILMRPVCHHMLVYSLIPRTSLKKLMIESIASDIYLANPFTTFDKVFNCMNDFRVSGFGQSRSINGYVTYSD